MRCIHRHRESYQLPEWDMWCDDGILHACNVYKCVKNCVRSPDNDLAIWSAEIGISTSENWSVKHNYVTFVPCLEKCALISFSSLLFYDMKRDNIFLNNYFIQVPSIKRFVTAGRRNNKHKRNQINRHFLWFIPKHWICCV